IHLGNPKEAHMNGSGLLGSQGHRLLQLGIALFLFTSFEGFVIPYFPAPLVGRSVHTLGALLGVMLLGFGLLWTKLDLGVVAARVAFWCLVCSGLAITVAFFLAAMWGAGKSTMPLSGALQGSAFQEVAIATVAYSSAPTGIISFALILWGLRVPPR